jgi:hypothetical protein
MALPMMNPQGTGALRFIQNIVYSLLVIVCLSIGFNIYTYVQLYWHIGKSKELTDKFEQCSIESTANANYIRETVEELKTCNKENIFLRDEYNVLRAKAEMKGIIVHPLKDE